MKMSKIFLLLFACVLLSCGNQKQEAIQIACNEINKNCPVFLDEITRMDNAVALTNTIQYNYTLMGIDYDDIDTEDWFSLKQHILQNIRLSDEMAALRDNDVTFIYNYKDDYGEVMKKFTIYPSDYK